MRDFGREQKESGIGAVAGDKQEESAINGSLQQKEEETTPKRKTEVSEVKVSLRWFVAAIVSFFFV